MKNLFLTIALMFCVSLAFANEDDKSKKEVEKPKVESKELQKKMNSDNNSSPLNNLVGPWTHCFGLTCRTHCIDYGADWTNDQIAEAWEKMEKDWCQYQPPVDHLID